MDSGPLALSRWLGVFRDPAAEAAFQEDLRPRLAAQLRFLALLPGLYVAATGFDYLAFGPHGAFWSLLALRLGVWLLVAISGVLATRTLRAAQLFLFAGLSLVMVGEVVEYHLLTFSRGPSLPQELPFIVLFVLGIYMMLPLGLRLSLLSSLFGTTLFLGYLAVTEGLDSQAVGLKALFLLFANGVGIAFRVTWNRIQRRDFVLRNRLEHEVAERKAAEAEARRANAAKSRFLAVMSHEIRTPLNGVLGGIQLLQTPSLRPEQRQALELLTRNGDLLARLLDDLLDLARIEAGHLSLAQEPFSPSELLAMVQATLQPQALAKGLDFRVEQGGILPPTLLGDTLRLRQVLINLVGNAVKFTERGEVVLSLEGREVPESPSQIRCTLCVRDTGPGLDEETQHRVFAPFEQGDMSIQRRHGGAGLGLAISRELVMAMGSELRLESAPGRGCSFCFSLILPMGESGSESVESSVQRTRRSILVVDDLEANRIVAAGLLELLGHHAICVPSGGVALKILDCHSLDAILLDLHMQDMDGLEALRRIRAHPNPRVAQVPIFLSSADSEGTRIQARSDTSVQGILPKPIRKEHLEALLAGLPSRSPEGTSSFPSQVDQAFVSRLRSDLGEDVWAQGLRACRDSAEASLEELGHPERAPQALHRLAGLAASYGMVDFHRLVRHAESELGRGGDCPIETVEITCRSSLARLEEA